MTGEMHATLRNNYYAHLDAWQTRANQTINEEMICAGYGHPDFTCMIY